MVCLYSRSDLKLKKQNALLIFISRFIVYVQARQYVCLYTMRMMMMIMFVMVMMLFMMMMMVNVRERTTL